MTLKAALLAIAGSLALTTAASAATYAVAAGDDLYNTDVGNLDGTSPIAIDVVGLTSLTFSATGSITLNDTSGSNYNDPDGIGAAPSTSSNSGANGIAGLTAPYAGYLTGAFVGSMLGSTPAPLDFTMIGTSFASLSPALQQAFFIGDGLTGDGTGSRQVARIPAGATELVLGISDACGFAGPPSCYYDNSGSYDVTYGLLPSGQ